MSSNIVSASEIRSWASHLTSEGRELGWVVRWYVPPEAVSQISRELKDMRGSVIGLLGVQGVGKSSALLYLLMTMVIQEQEEQERISKRKKADSPRHEYGTISFKWRRQNELFRSLVIGTHEDSKRFARLCCSRLLGVLEPRMSLPDVQKLRAHPESLNFAWAEKMLGRVVSNRLYQVVWLEMLGNAKTILIDMPDYSKTDRRLFAKDLDEIFWLWNHLAVSSPKKPNMVITIQKEMFGRHFFFDKMTKLELHPLKPEQMLQAYTHRFKTINPFTEDALLTIAKMSRGIFRRFLRYITLALDMWEAQGQPQTTIDTTIVTKAITAERVAEDLEPEMQELFPKENELRLHAVQILMRLDRSGPTDQSRIGEELEIRPYTMSRILAKLELHHYIKRKRSGNDKIVTLQDTSEKEARNSASPTAKADMP